MTQSAGSPLVHGLTTTEAGFLALRDEWDALWQRVAHASPFQHPAWLLAWWRQFGTPEPRVAWVRQDGRLVGLLPLYVLAEPAGRKLLPIGAGLTDYQDGLAEPHAAGTLFAEGMAAALQAEPQPLLADLICLPPDAGLRCASAPGWRAILSPADPCPVLDLTAPVPARQRRKLRMNRHRADRIGGWTVEHAAVATFGSIWSELCRLHQTRWTAIGEPGVLADSRVPAFLHEAATALLPTGMVRLVALRLKGRVAAACFALLQEDRILFYLSGYDAEFAQESPGTILLGHMLEEATREGRREAHFLRGSEAYKYAWGAVDRFNATVSLRPRR